MFEYKEGDLVPVLDPGSGLPIVGTTPMNNIPGAPLGDNSASLAFEQALLLQGYALAASNYKPDPQYDAYGLAGWIVEDGIADTIAVTRFAKYLLGKTKHFPRRTLLWARSQGSLIAFNIVEQRERPHYDGLISVCTVGAGGPRNWDHGLDIALAFDTAFSHLGGWNEAEWGPLEGGGSPLHLSFAESVAPSLVGLLADPANYGLFEFMRLVSGLPEQGFYPSSPTDGYNWLFVNMLFVTEVRADLESPHKANGRVAQNKHHMYTLRDDDKHYLATLGVDADSLLQQMNAQTKFKAEPKARKYIENFSDVTGDIDVPVISLHTTVDGLVILENETALLETVTKARKEHNLLQLYTQAVGHCVITPDQLLVTLAAMEQWVDTGDRPPRDQFPAALGFDPTFQPGPWPQP
jgi:hypothetical protein